MIRKDGFRKRVKAKFDIFP